MQIVVTSEHRFSLGLDGSVWAKVTYGYPFWERYLTEFDSVRIVARARIDPDIDESYQAVTGTAVDFWPLPYYLGPEQFLLRRNQVRRSLHASVGPEDALLCRVGSPLADELLSSFWRENRPYGLEVVGDPHEAMGPRTIRHPLRPLFRSLAARSLRKQCSHAAAVAYVTRDRLQKRYPCQAHSVGVSDVGPLDFRPDAKVFTTNYSSVSCEDVRFVDRARFFRDGERPTILFIGSLAQMYKGGDLLISAIKYLLPDISPNVILVGDGKYRVELQELSQKLRVSEYVTFLGELPSGQAIRDQLDQATLFVMPSRTEGLPRAMIEAMTRAVPCIGTRVGGIPELLDHEDMVEAEDVIGLASKIREVLTDPERLSRMSDRNLKRAQEYRPEVLTTRRNEFYRFLRRTTEDWSAMRGRGKPQFATASECRY